MKNCKICNSTLDLSTCQVFSSTCFLNHVPLKRYKCPTCGVIFGTIEMINGTVDTVKKAYLFCDTVYKEANSVVNETRTFMSLAPKKSGLYLNFGCGNTSTTVADLRKQGWNILGYEPFLPNPLPNIIKDKSLLCNFKFDGIMSNNLLEHLQDPVADLVFLKGLLKDKGSLMAHSTPCYKYCAEFSLYHLYFFIDKSVEYLCKSAGLKIKSYVKDGDYINYIYEQV